MLYTGRLLHSRHLLGMRVQQVGSTVTWPHQKCRAHAAFSSTSTPPRARSLGSERV